MLGPNEILARIQEELSEKLLSVFELVLKERSSYYAEGNEKPTLEDVDQIINSYVKTNTAVSAGLNLIPGPAGLMAAIPEILTVIRNQIAMVYDICVAYDKERFLNRDLLMGVFAEDTTATGNELVLVHGDKLILKSTSQLVFKKVVAVLATKLAEQLVKRSIAKFVPFAGAAAIATWTRHMTKKLGLHAKELLALDIELEDIPFEDLVDITPTAEKDTDPTNYEEPDTINSEVAEKIKALIYVMKVDKKVEDEELELIDEMITNAELNGDVEVALRDLIDSSQTIKVDYSIFENDADAALSLIMDIIGIAKRDGNVHISEKMYIKRVGKQLSFDAADIDEMLEA